MLIRSIRAENFMRFSSVKLTDLPREGVIGIEGPNESGKSTLGEILLFAFFGRMRLARQHALERLIRWGAESLWVEVGFSLEPSGGSSPGAHDSGGDYLIYREIDKHGTNYVKVLRLPDRLEVAMGNIQVPEFLASKVRFGFEEFLQSFYHDQYENRNIQADQVAFFERATGIDRIATARAEIEREVTESEREFSYLQKEIARNKIQIEKHDRNVQKLEPLRERSSRLENDTRQQKELVLGSQERSQKLRREAEAREERGGRLASFPGLKPEDILAEIDGFVASDGHLAHGPSELYPDGDLRETVLRSLPRLEELRSFVRAASDFLHLVRDEREEVRKQLEEIADGPGAERRRLDAVNADLMRRRGRRSRLALVLVCVSLLLLSACLLFVLDLLNGGAGPASGLVARVSSALVEALGTGAARAASLTCGILSTASLVSSVILFARSRADQAKLEDARELRNRLDERIVRLRDTEAKLGRVLDHPALRAVASALGDAASIGHAVVTRRAAEVRKQHMALLGGAGDRLASCVEDLVGAQKALAAELAADASKSDKERQKADAALRKARSERDKVEHEIRECESQNAKKQALEEKNSELEAEAARARGEMDLRLDACRLLDETAASMRHKMAPSLTRFVRRLLPRLTAERYREVKVEENLEIKVFSSEKSDFLSVLELSGGANEALGLAFRLALSQTLIGARSRQTQFVFLDEPFKMMDAGRSMSTLRTLRELSPDLKQFFIIQPDFTAAEREALSSLVRTSLETDELEYSGLPLETVSSEPQPPP